MQRKGLEGYETGISLCKADHLASPRPMMSYQWGVECGSGDGQCVLSYTSATIIGRLCCVGQAEWGDSRPGPLALPRWPLPFWPCCLASSSCCVRLLGSVSLLPHWAPHLASFPTRSCSPAHCLSAISPSSSQPLPTDLPPCGLHCPGKCRGTSRGTTDEQHLPYPFPNCTAVKGP